ncbi:response regulator [Phaeovibrio sulfidiphilus]|uniref:Response regulator n=1 Tax=Phaeovibrio sulfidiphilus TaxID=1220600 RepID=A0A8J7CWB6_9PROT|nr:response regulator [Phaeovibrio sulfidiphilus]MBE1237291.1 response regulator [Phaeovibrio sulfidiphilus]
MSSPSESNLVLVIDDDPAVCRAVGAGVEELGWHYREARDGQEALELLDTETFDLVVSDVWMPRLDGISFLKKARERHPGLRVLAISGGGDAPAALSLKILQMHGASDILYKPFTSEELKERLLALGTARPDAS